MPRIKRVREEGERKEPRLIERSGIMFCVICRSPFPTMYSALYEGPVHEICHAKSLEKIRQNRQRLEQEGLNAQDTA